MNKELQRFVERTEREHKGRLRSVKNLLAWKPSDQDWIDTCILGGESLVDVLTGHVTDADLDPQVLEAFHAQYPHLGSLVAKINELRGDPDALRGLLSGIKGKLFEEDYVDFLNHSHLPPGYEAVLASPQPKKHGMSPFMARTVRFSTTCS